MCLLDLAILVLLCVPNSLDIVTVASTFATSTAFSGIMYLFLLLTLFSTVTVIVNILYGEIQST